MNGTLLSVDLVAQNGSVANVRGRFVVDGSPEARGAAAFGLLIRLGREGQVASQDPSRSRELWAGRRLFAKRMKVTNGSVEIGEYPIRQSLGDPQPEEEDSSMGASPVFPTRLYGSPGQKRNLSAPWVLKRPPVGYDERDYLHFSNDSAVLEIIPMGFNTFRYSGKERVKSLPGWWKQQQQSGKKMHYLRNVTHVWEAKRDVEHRAFAYALGALWYIQHTERIHQGWRYGVDNDAFTRYGAPFTLADFGTESHGGDMPCCARLYHRTLGRLECGDAQWGGQLILQRSM